ncbi:thiamine pyrophosphate-binding protein [Zwartia vadi]|uniref:thiamine pyrophosphate-binding protein n=1 Tax=Zwartia vadi TaxID=3058168 RepID=UPI0025B34483|nr:thiamine pyrophosphate-binding protein [Zwartia vadi]MDN3986747.1 thiamine pyrophosphate-binding protein [Zwartia vadi]
MNQEITVAQLFVRKLSQAGVKKIFGLPGGGSSLDIIAAASNENIEFVLTKTENAAVMMAGALAESTGIPGVALMTKGPGLTNSANGVAYASLDRAPVIVLTDGFTPKQLSYITHQVFDQKAVLAPIVKGTSRLESSDPGAEIDALLRLACSYPLGPVHIELTSETARRLVSDQYLSNVASSVETPSVSLSQLETLRLRIKQADRPIVVLGLEARAHADAVRGFVDTLGCAVLTTYKAKGVVPDSDKRVVGIFTGGSLEQEAIAAADLMVLIGMDPVELILQPWRYTTPVVDIAACLHPVHYVEPELRVVGSITSILNGLRAKGIFSTAGWSDEVLESIRIQARRQLEYLTVSQGVAPDRVAQLAAECCQRHAVSPMFSIDAGAHMFSVAAFFPAERAGDVLISNGLATMAFALPAAISAAVQNRNAPVLCFTGDGGLMMCLGELCTAVEQQAKVIVIVFNDSALSLIDIKQRSRSLEPVGVRWRHHNFAAMMDALGGYGVVATSEQEFNEGLNQALSRDGPSLIDVLIDPSGYPEQLKAMRG